jgi:MFS superfamily sulfate permease-like transporter
MVFRLDAPLLAFNAQTARNLLVEQFRASDPVPSVVVLDLEASSTLDVGAVYKLEQLHREFAEVGAEFWLARVHGDVDRMLDVSGVRDLLGGHVYRTLGEALEAFEARPESSAR